MSDAAIDRLESRPPMITDMVYGRLYSAIIERRLAPGSLLTEQALAEQLEVSKTPVREALLRLREAGLIEPDGKRGLRVVRLTRDAVRHTLEVREALETFVAARAAERVDVESARKILQAAENSLTEARAANATAFQHYDRVFHGAIAGVVANPRITHILENAVALVQTVVRSPVFPDAHGMVYCGQAHVRIAQAIGAGSREGAAREMADHVRLIHDLIVQETMTDWDDDAPVSALAI